MERVVEGSGEEPENLGEGSGEEPLPGGNVSAVVVRVGGTVRRPAGPWTPAVHALLAHLHAAGFRGAPGRWASTNAGGRC